MLKIIKISIGIEYTVKITDLCKICNQKTSSVKRVSRALKWWTPS